MTEAKRKLIEGLHIELKDSDREISEKLFCAALVHEGKDATSRILKRYIEMRDVLRRV